MVDRTDRVKTRKYWKTCVILKKVINFLLVGCSALLRKENDSHEKAVK